MEKITWMEGCQKGSRLFFNLLFFGAWAALILAAIVSAGAQGL